MNENDEWGEFYYWGALADDVVKYLISRKVIYAQLYTPYYLASVGAHIANIGSNCLQEDMSHFEGREGTHFYSNAGKPMDCRLHIFFTAPPGFSKSFTLSQFIDRHIGFLQDTHITTRRYASISTAGLVGSAVAAKGKNAGQGINVPGDAEIYKTGVFGFDEISSVLSQREDYNVEMVNTMLQLLDEGNIVKRTVFGNFDFKSYATVWGGTQPLRVNLSYGLARRFLILKFSPTYLDRKKYATEQAESIGIKPNMDEIKNIRRGINDIWEGFAVKECFFEPKFEEFKRKYDISHIDSEWINRLGIGWNVVTNYEPGEDTLMVGMQHHLDDMILNALKWRYSALIDGIRVDIVKMVDADKEYTVTDLKRTGCKNLGISYKDMSVVIEEMKADGLFELAKRNGRFSTYKLAVPEVLHKIVDEQIKQIPSSPKDIIEELF